MSAIPSEDSPGTLLERWCIHYCPSVTGIAFPLSPGGLSRSQMARLSPKHVYKRLMLLIRSVYSYCRVLPAFKLYRIARETYRSPPFYLKYKLHSTLPQRGDAISGRMHRFEFSPVETADAKLQVSVEYQPASTIKVLGQAAVRLPRPAIINDYVREMNTNSLDNNRQQQHLLQRGKSQGITTTTAAAMVAAGGGGTTLEPAPSAPAALSSGGSTPRRGWSSSFRLSPARIYEPPVYYHEKYPSPGSPSPSYGTSAGGTTSAAAGTSVPETVGVAAASSQPGSGNTIAPIPTTETARPPIPPTHNQEKLSQQSSRLQNQQQERAPSPFEVTGGSAETTVAEPSGDLLEEKSSKEGSRVSSSPMAIPGTSAACKRRPQGFRSSGDLGALGRKTGNGDGGDGGVGGGGGRYADRKIGAGAIGGNKKGLEFTSEKPMSAPAVSYMHYFPDAAAIAAPSATPDDNRDEEENATGAENASSADEHLLDSERQEIAAAPTVPGNPKKADQGHPLPSITVKLNTASYSENMDTTSSYTCYPVPSSPDLPFAFTPSARYSCSPASVASGSGGGRGGGGLLRSFSRPSPTFSSSGGSDIHHQHQYGAATPPKVPPANQMIVPSTISSSSTSPSSFPNNSNNNNLSGREIPAGTALMRRASWGTRSFRDTTTGTGAAGAVIGQGQAFSMKNAVGYSISPIRDTMLESVLLSASTSKNLMYTNRAGSDAFLAGSSRTPVGSGGGGGAGEAGSNKRDPLLLTFPRGSHSQGVERRAATANSSTGARLLPREDSEQLPFDFTGDASSEEQSHNSSNNGGRSDIQEEGETLGSQELLRKSVAVEGNYNNDKNIKGELPPVGFKPTFDVQSSAASIGAFMRLINEAQPLSGLAPIPIEVGMHQLEAFKSKLSSTQQR
jgi:Autophagy-related protein 13